MPLFKRRKLVEPGATAPDFRLPGLDGAETSLKEIAAGGPALIAFFKISCPVCQLAFPYLDRIHTPGALPVYGISQNSAADTRAFTTRFSLALPMLLDSEASGYPASNAYGISSVPTMFLIETDGSVSRVIEGWQKREIEWLGSQAGVNVFRQGDNVPEWKAG